MSKQSILKKLQWNITSYQSNWLSSKNLHTINAGESMERREPSYTVCRNVNWYSHYGEQDAAAAESLQLCPTLCDPIDCSPPGFPVPEILWRFLKKIKIEPSVQFSSVIQSCPALCDPMNHSTPGLPVHHQLPEFTQNSCPLSQ